MLSIRTQYSRDIHKSAPRKMKPYSRAPLFWKGCTFFFPVWEAFKPRDFFFSIISIHRPTLCMRQPGPRSHQSFLFHFFANDKKLSCQSKSNALTAHRNESRSAKETNQSFLCDWSSWQRCFPPGSTRPKHTHTHTPWWSNILKQVGENRWWNSISEKSSFGFTLSDGRGWILWKIVAELEWAGKGKQQTIPISHLSSRV